MRGLAIAGLVAAAGVSALFLASASATARIEAEWPAHGRFVRALGEDVHYREAGSGQPVILIHGASGNLRDFEHGGHFERLAKRYRVIAVDRPGAGHSSRRGADLHDPRRQAAVLAAAAEALGARDPIVVGHSWGGAVALAWAMKQDAKGGVLLGGVAMERRDAPSLLYRTVDTPIIGPLLATAAPFLFDDGYIARALDGIFAPQPAPESYARDLGAALATRPATGRATAADRVRLSDILAEMSEGYPALDVPFEIITGDMDGSVPPEVHSYPLAAALPDARLTVLEGVGHMPHHARPDALDAALARLAAR